MTKIKKAETKCAKAFNKKKISTFQSFNIARRCHVSQQDITKHKFHAKKKVVTFSSLCSDFLSVFLCLLILSNLFLLCFFDFVFSSSSFSSFCFIAVTRRHSVFVQHTHTHSHLTKTFTKHLQYV